uniref:Uncharacterized protein n=1 Tax=Romanomermis culicivorax TaxID=13658 RepID=A0A915L2J8_ROMCU
LPQPLNKLVGSPNLSCSLLLKAYKSDFLTPQKITGFWAMKASYHWEEPSTFHSSNLEGECGVEDEEEVL